MEDISCSNHSTPAFEFTTQSKVSLLCIAVKLLWEWTVLVQLEPQFPTSSLPSKPSVFPLTSLKLFIFVKTLHSSCHHKIKFSPNLIIFIYITTFFLSHPNIGGGTEIWFDFSIKRSYRREHR